MFLVAVGSVSIIRQLAPAVAASVEVGAAQRALSTIDQLIMVVSIVITAAGVTWWLISSRHDPLATAPHRENTLREDALVLALTAYLLVAALGSTVVHYVGDATEESMLPHLIGSGAQLAGIVVCLLIARKRFQGGVRGFCLGVDRTSFWLLMVTAGALVLVAMGLCPQVLRFSVWVGEHLAPGFRFEPHPTIEALHRHPRSVGTVIALWIGASLIAPVAEEFFFRGLLQTFLTTVLGSRWKAIVVASVAFALVHLAQPHAVPALAVFSLLMGFAYERTGALLTPIAMHAAFNLRTLLWDALSGPATLVQ